MTTVTDQITPAYGGNLTNLIVDDDRAAALRRHSASWPSWTLGPRQICDLELLMNGGFSPLTGFMTQKDYEGVCQNMRLADGTLWPLPIVLDVPATLASQLDDRSILALRDAEGVMLAALHVTDIWQPDRLAEAQAVFGTTSREHPGVAWLMDRTNPYYVGGRIEAIQTPSHYDFRSLRLTPEQVRDSFRRAGWSRVVAFQTRNPMHRAHYELTRRAAQETGAGLLVHPVVGMTKPGDVDHYTRVRCYRAVMETYPQDTAKLALLPLAMRMGGPREVLLHAIIRRNYGCTHLIVGRDHAGPGKQSNGEAFYGPYDSQESLQKHSAEIGVEMVPFRDMQYLSDRDTYVPENEVPEGAPVLNLSGTQLRRLLHTGDQIPEWFTFPAVATQLRATHRPRAAQGFTIFMTGLSGSGKSTIANVLLVKLLERGGRAVTLLDGDLVRQHLSSELGFSKEHRDLNIRRIGFVASEITKHGGAAICAPIAPFDATRREVRQMIEPHGGFVLVHIATPLEICEQRDRKGLYAKARAGLIPQFTGVSDAYEPPADASITIDTTACTPEEAADRILDSLVESGFLEPAGQPA
jgi:sulfate adenylyltransferase